MKQSYNPMKPVPSFSLGENVILRDDVLQRHSRSVPAHMGYTTEQFAWRDTLQKYASEVGEVTRVFDSGHTNVTFSDGLTIGIEQSELIYIPKA